MISVLISVYNASEFLQNTLESVINQTYRDLEIIVVNDGSTDNSREILKSISDKRLKVIDQENKGQSAAINEALRYSRGEYIKIVDADDILNFTHLEAQMDRMQARNDVLVSSSWGRFYDGNPNSARFSPELVWKDMSNIDWLKASLRQKNDMMPGWLWLIPRTIIEKSGGYDERLSLNNDFEFSIRLLRNAKEVLFAERAKVYYRSGIGESLASIKSKTAYESAILSTDLGCRYLLEMDNSNEMQRLCANRYQVWTHRIYPDYLDLVEKLERKIEGLGGSSIHCEGGRIFSLLRSIFGWKRAKEMQRKLHNLGWKWVAKFNYRLSRIRS